MLTETKRVLITVKTYPLPSTSAVIKEHVCTAGLLEDGTFIRLCPVDYRYRPYWEWYSKYEWIEVEVTKNKHDPRPESYTPIPDSEIIRLTPPLPTKDDWKQRKAVVLRCQLNEMCELRELSYTDQSLALIRPREITDFIAKPTDREWKPEWRTALKQESLFGPSRKPLEKIPYKFTYKFKCNASTCNGHEMMIEDWEIGKLFLNMRDQHHSEDVAKQKVREKFFDTMCSDKRDTYFFVGTTIAHGTWIVLGVFWPPKEQVNPKTAELPLFRDLD